MQTSFIETLEAYANRLESGGVLAGTELAHCLTLLAEHEVAPGGPYTSCAVCKNPDRDTNLAVARVLTALDVHLPNLHAFLSRELGMSEHMRTEYSWLLRDEPVEPGYVSHEESFPELDRCLDETLTNVAPELAHTVRKMLKTTMKRNQDRQMTHMPEYLRDALGSKGLLFSDRRVAELGLASAFFWTSFIAYDDFWDEDEAADPLHLPAANFMARHFINTLTTASSGTGPFMAYVHTMMDRLDAANAWEVTHCRMEVSDGVVQIPDILPAYEDFSIKFYPAAGQCLAPVLMLVEIGYAVDSREVTALVEYFKHYLIAMQLNDDMHDWKEDLERGHISTAVAVLLLEWKRLYPDRMRIALKGDGEVLEQAFWERVVDPLSACVLERAEWSRAALADAGLENPEPLTRFIAAVEDAAQRALNERALGEELVSALQSMS